MNNYIEKIFKKIPPFTRYYMLAIAIITIASKINDKKLFLDNIKLSYKKIFQNFEIWRLITCFLYIKSFSPQMLISFYFMFKRFKSTEIKLIKQNKLAEFIMMIFYLCLFIHICNIISICHFHRKSESYLTHHLMFAILYINCKRYPFKNFRIRFVNMQNQYVPYFLFIMRASKSGILKQLIGVIPGITYYLLKDMMVANGKKDYLVTPKWLIDYVEKNYYRKKKKKKEKNGNLVEENDNKKNKNKNVNKNNDNKKEKIN